MLAQNFKSADDLGISEKSHESLIKTLALMETGRIIHVKDYEYVMDDDEDADPEPFTGHFNMENWSVKATCGTVACIGGTAEKIGAFEFGGAAHPVTDKLNDLFYMDELECNMGKATVEQAARALRNYLTYGEGRWKEVMEIDNG